MNLIKLYFVTYNIIVQKRIKHLYVNKRMMVRVHPLPQLRYLQYQVTQVRILYFPPYFGKLAEWVYATDCKSVNFKYLFWSHSSVG